jgi:hypothetical protein
MVHINEKIFLQKGIFEIARLIIELCKSNNLDIQDTRMNEPEVKKLITDTGALLVYHNGLPCTFWTPWGNWNFIQPKNKKLCLPLSNIKKYIDLSLIYPYRNQNLEDFSIQVIQSIPAKRIEFPIPTRYIETDSAEELLAEWRLNLLLIDKVSR